MAIQLLERELDDLNRICGDMIETAWRMNRSIDLWEFHWQIDFYRKFFGELEKSGCPHVQLIAKRAREILESTIRIVQSPHSRTSRRLCKRIERCLKTIETHLPKVYRG